MISRSAEAPARPHVVVVGDLVLDRYQIDGREFEKPGCAGNILAALDASQLNCSLYSSFADPDCMRFLLKETAPSCEIVVRPATGFPNVVLYSEQGGAARQLEDHPRPAAVDHDLSTLESMLAVADIIIICDHRLGTLTPEVQALSRRYVVRCAHSYVDCRHGNYDDYAGFESLLPNPAEYSRLRARGQAPRSHTDLRRMGFCTLFQKRGAEGVRWIERANDCLVHSPAVVVADDFGAGDYLIAEIVNTHGVCVHDFATIALAVERVSARLTQVGGGFLKPVLLSVDFPHI